MKLTEIIGEANMYTVTVHDPSGAAGQMSVDPDQFPNSRDMRKLEKDRARRIRRKFRLKKKMRTPYGDNVQMKNDNEDLTGSGANSAVNGPFNY